MNNPPKFVRYFCAGSWPNIGPAAAGPAGSAPTALQYSKSVTSFLRSEWYFSLPNNSFDSIGVGTGGGGGHRGHVPPHVS